MRVLHICYSDLEGGAARACYRLHQALQQAGVDSHMLVLDKSSDDLTVHTVSSAHRIRIKLSSLISKQLLRKQKSHNPIVHSLNLFPSGLLRTINELNPDVVNLHWISGEMLSVTDIARLSYPIVWTLHDMWAFCGCEHYDDERPSERYRHGYSVNSRHPQDHGLDINRWNFLRKQSAWKNTRLHIVTPSRWLGECAKQSQLFANQPVQVIPNCIDYNIYRPLDKTIARTILGLPKEKQLLLFGAMDSTSDPRKGYQLLIPALKTIKLQEKGKLLELVIFGASQGDVEDVTGIRTHYMGRLHDDISLNLLYNAADLFVAPSLQDNLPNTLVESLACGTPCVAFDIGGMGDLITSNSMGFLCDRFDNNSLAAAIMSQLSYDYSPHQISNDSKFARSEDTVACMYIKLYKNILND